MEAKAIIMALIGFFFLYGGLVCCIGIAWYHTRQKNNGKTENQS
ncbi:MAG: MetS family NSS transporter small subunit [Spirochaetes bacterium]|nr:MetS family NSS transporter small subunit [Spirochaetota bacterium]